MGWTVEASDNGPGEDEHDPSGIQTENHYNASNDDLRREMERVQRIQQMMLAAQDKLIETLSGQHEPKVPEILMKGFSICPRCGIEALTHYPDRTIWCANCNLRSVWKMERVPLCPHCRAISLSFHPSGKARCLFCTFEFRYKPGIEGEHKGEKDPFVPVREILQKGQSEMKEWVRETESQRTGTREIMRPIRGGPEEEKTPFMLSEDERKGLKRAGRGDPAEGEWESLEKLARSLEDDIGKAGRKGLNIEHMWSDYDIGYGYLGSGDLTVARDIFSRLKLELYRMLSESKEPAEKDAEIVYSDETIPGDVDDITSENGETPAGDRKGMETAGMDEDEAAVEVLEYKEDEEPGEALETADQGEPAEASMDARSAPVRKKTKRVKREAAPRRAEYEERSLQCPICMIPVGRDEEICPVCGVFVSEVKDRERTKPLPPLEQMRPRVSREKLRSIMGRDGIEHTGARSPSGHPRIYGRSDSRPVRKTKGGLGKIEKKIGTLILLVVGILIVTTGLVFLGMLSWSKIGNNGKIAIIFIFAALLAGAAEWLYRRNKMLTFSKGLSTLSFLAAYTGAGVMYYYDYSFTLIIAAGMIIILLNIAASYRYQMYLLIGVSIIASYILATMMRMSKTDAGEPLISAPVYAGLLVGIAALFTAASYLVFNRTKSSKMAYITSIVSNIWLIAFNGQMNDEVLISGSIIMLLTALLATGTSKIGFGQVKDRKSRITGRASKKATRMSHRDFQKLEKERKKLLHFQYLWYGSLLLSLLVCIMVSARNIASISIGSLEVHWGGVMFFMALLTYAVSALYLGNELRAPWIFSAITFAAGIAAGLFLGTFWPVAISFLLANSLLLIWKRRRFLYYGSLMASLVLCVLVSAEGTRSIPMGSYDLPWTSFLFMAVLLAFAVHSMNMGRTIRHSYLYSVLTFAAGLASGFCSGTLWPAAVSYLVVHVILLGSGRYRHSEIFYPLMAALILIAHAIGGDARILLGLPGWGLFAALIPLFFWTHQRKEKEARRRSNVFMITIGVSTLIMAVITPGLSYPAAIVSLMALLSVSIWYTYRFCGKDIGSDLKPRDYRGFSETEMRAIQYLKLTLISMMPGLYLTIYTMMDLLAFWEYLPVLFIPVLFVPLGIFQGVRKLPSFPLMLSALGTILVVLGTRYDIMASNEIIMITLMAGLLWIGGMFWRYNRKHKEGITSILRGEYTASWLSYAVLLLCIVFIDRFDLLSPYLFWGLILLFGVSTMLLPRDVIERRLGLLLLSVLLVVSGSITMFSGGNEIDGDGFRDFFLPAVVTLVSLAYLAGRLTPGKFGFKHVAKGRINRRSGKYVDPEMNEDPSGVIWLIFALVMASISCCLGDMGKFGPSLLERYWIFIFFSVNWLVLYLSHYNHRSKPWYVIAPFLAFWSLGLSIDDGATLGLYLALTLIFTSIGHSFLKGLVRSGHLVKGEKKGRGNATRRRARKKNDTEDAGGPEGNNPPEGSFYRYRAVLTMISLSAVGLGLLSGGGILSTDGDGSPDSTFYILMFLSLLHVIVSMRFLARFSRGRISKPDNGVGEAHGFRGFVSLFTDWENRSVLLLSGGILFFVLCTSISALDFMYFSIAISGMLLLTGGFLFLVYRNRENIWGYLIYGIPAAFLARIATSIDVMDVHMTPTTVLSGMVSDAVICFLCISLAYLVWKRDTVKVYSQFNRLSPLLLVSLLFILFITPAGKFGRYAVPLVIGITAFKLRDAWSYPIAVLLFLLTFYLFTGNPSNPEEATRILTTFQRQILIIIVMGVILMLVLATHRRMKREPLTSETVIGLSAGIFITALLTFKGDQHWLISLVWAILGLSLVYFGYTLKKSWLRWEALVIIGLVVLKILIKDSSNLALGYRVAVFLTVGVIVLLVSLLYYKLADWYKKAVDTEEDD